MGERGPQGQQGPSGQSLGVRDKDGNLVGPLVSVDTTGPAPIFTVLIDEGLYPYGPSGRLARSSFGGPLFRNAGCNGTAYLAPMTQPEVIEQWTSAAGSQARVVYRLDSSTAARAWKITSQTVDITSESLYGFSESNGQCALINWPRTGTMVALEPVQPPRDFAGPLSIG